MISIAAFSALIHCSPYRRERPFPRGRADTFPHLPSRRMSRPAGACCAGRESVRWEWNGFLGSCSLYPAKLRTSRVPSFWDKTWDKTRFVPSPKMAETMVFFDMTKEPRDRMSPSSEESPNSRSPTAARRQHSAVQVLNLGADRRFGGEPRQVKVEAAGGCAPPGSGRPGEILDQDLPGLDNCRLSSELVLSVPDISSCGSK
jgi:hypothetical protein